MNIFVINAGSSSLKYQLFDMEREEVIAKGLCQRIGIDGHIKHQTMRGDKPVYEQELSLPNHREALSAVLFTLMSHTHGAIRDVREIHAIGHRVVHGGETFASSVLINDEVMNTLENCVPLAPLHNPANIDGIEACRRVMVNVPQVAVFDTAFHQSMPRHAYIYALPYKYYEQHKIRRYGFHGTSHRYVSQRAAEILGTRVEELRLITCHMGNGSSICAVEYGKSIDTSMGFTPVAGLPMGTRAGDMDAGVLGHIMERENIGMSEMLRILNNESGVLGISGVSSDFRDIENAVADGNGHARLALQIFEYNVAKYIGSYAAAMNGVDAIVFTAGLGENSPETRASVASRLGYLGAELDATANETRGTEVISTQESKVKLMVVPTNEELVIARDTRDIVSSGKTVTPGY